MSYYCILIAGILPYIFIFIAKSKKNYLSHNNAPRLYLENISGFRQRSHWASINSLEAFPFFAAAILTANITGNINTNTLNILALSFITTRIIYGVMYLADLATLRSISWIVSIAIIIAIFILSIH